MTLAVMPWNYPFWQVFRYAAPALMTGNSILLKHASNVCGCALDIETVFQDAGYPEGVFQTLLIGSRRVPAVLENPLVKAVTLTGSKAAGQAVPALGRTGVEKKRARTRRQRSVPDFGRCRIEADRGSLCGQPTAQFRPGRKPKPSESPTTASSDWARPFLPKTRSGVSALRPRNWRPETVS
jgi:hypothetical protein